MHAPGTGQARHSRDQVRRDHRGPAAGCGTGKRRPRPFPRQGRRGGHVRRRTSVHPRLTVITERGRLAYGSRAHSRRYARLLDAAPPRRRLCITGRSASLGEAWRTPATRDGITDRWLVHWTDCRCAACSCRPRVRCPVRSGRVQVARRASHAICFVEPRPGPARMGHGPVKKSGEGQDGPPSAGERQATRSGRRG